MSQRGPAPPQPSPQPRWHSQPWWQAVGAIVGIGALIVAVIIGYLDWTDKDPTPGPTSHAPTQPTTPVTTPTSDVSPSEPETDSPSSETPPPVSKTPAAAVRWTGDFLVHNVTGVDLDGSPRPRLTTGPKGNWDDGDLQYWNPDARDYTLYGEMAEWTENAEPTRSGCDDALETAAIGGLVPRDDQKFCVRSAEGHIAFVRVKSAEYDNLRLTMLVWE